MRRFARLSTGATALVALGISLTFSASAMAAVVTNGDFGTSDLTGWTTFTTSNGTIGSPTVTSFDTTGSGASDAAQFDVGGINFTPGVQAGGGIYQTVTTDQGTYTASADVAALPTGGPNAECGVFTLLVDGSTVAQHDIGPCSATIRAHLSGTVSLTAGTHELRVKITRPYTTQDGLTPYQYLDNVGLTLSQQSQSITFAAPTGVTYGGSDFDLGATGGGSGNPVTYSTTTPSVCTIDSLTGYLHIVSAGWCTVDANQTGNSQYSAATQVERTFEIAKASQSILFSSIPPSTPRWLGSYPVKASGGVSGNAVVFSVDSSSDPDACSLSGSTVSFTGVGKCVIDANQAGNGNYSAATQMQQTLIIAAQALPTGGTCNNVALAGTITHSVTVPKGATCLLSGGASVGQSTAHSASVLVGQGATLIDQGATITGNVLANSPAGVWIGGSQPSVIDGNLAILGLTGASPRSNGDTSICNTTIGGGLQISEGTAGAAPLMIGTGPDCAGGNTIGGQLVAQDNANHLDIESNTIKGDATLQKNSGGTVFSSNHVGSDPLCRQNTPAATGSANTYAGRNTGCPA